MKKFGVLIAFTFGLAWLATAVDELFPSVRLPLARQWERLGAAGFKSEVLARDARGRVKVFQVFGERGSCMAEAVYDFDRPRIYVVVISPQEGIRNIGYLQINDGTEAGLGDAALLRNFHKVMRERCLPLITRRRAYT